MTDITINQNWDDTRNQRLIIIYGDTNNNGVNKNGQMDIISSMNNKVSIIMQYILMSMLRIIIKMIKHINLTSME